MCGVWEFRDEILLRGRECKIREKKSNFLKNGKNNKNFHNGLGKPGKF